MSQLLPSWYASDDLAGFERYAWSLVARGVKDRRSPFHTPALATVDADGMADARTLVLRGCDEQERTLRFHSDARASKLIQIERDPRGTVLFYDAGNKLQLRMRGTIEVATDGSSAGEAWSATRPFSRVCYRVRPAPGTELASGDDYAHPDGEGEDEGRENFAVLLIAVSSVEALYLAAAGHRRARFGPDGSSWLVP